MFGDGCPQEGVGVKKMGYVLWQGKGASRCVVSGGGQVQPSWSVKSATSVGRVGLRTICHLLGCRFGDKAARRQITVLPFGFSHHAAHGLGRRPSGLSVPYLNEMPLKCARGNRCGGWCHMRFSRTIRQQQRNVWTQESGILRH